MWYNRQVDNTWFSTQDVCEKSRYVSGSFDLVLVKEKKTSTDSKAAEIIVDETQRTQDLEFFMFSLTQKNYLEIREREGQAIEMVHPSMVGMIFSFSIWHLCSAICILTNKFFSAVIITLKNQTNWCC